MVNKNQLIDFLAFVRHASFDDYLVDSS